MSEPSLSPAVGRRIRAERRARDWTVDQVAEKAGVSKGLLSQLERGLGNPSIGNLHKIAESLDLPLSQLFLDGTPVGAPEPTTVQPAGRRRPSFGIVRADARKQLVFPRERITYELLTPDLQRSLEVLRCVIPHDWDTEGSPFCHEGEECVYVVRGRLEGHVGNETFVLEPGDSAGYPADIPHWWRSLSYEEGEVICAITPPSF
jgi:transcriptional regulator with XRE-family HTH domain